MTLALGVVAGLILGLLRGGHLAGLARIDWRLWQACLLGLAIQLPLFAKDSDFAHALAPYGAFLHVLSIALVLASILANWRIFGVPVIALGAVLNLAVIVANGGQMPRATPPEAAPFRNTVAAGPDTQLWILGDWIPIPALPGREFSLGDVAVAFGGGMVAYGLVAKAASTSSTRPPN